MAHGIINTVKVKATKVGHIYSVVASKDLDNGSVGTIGDLVTGEMEVRNFVDPATADLGKKPLAVIATPEIIYDQSTTAKGALGNFYNPANVPAVALELVQDDEVEVSVDMITPLATTPVVGNYLVAANGSNKLSEIASPAGTEKFVAKIEYIRPSGIATFVGASSNVYNIVGYRVIQN